jgi:hypothetical protein
MTRFLVGYLLFIAFMGFITSIYILRFDYVIFNLSLTNAPIGPNADKAEKYYLYENVRMAYDLPSGNESARFKCDFTDSAGHYEYGVRFMNPDPLTPGVRTLITKSWGTINATHHKNNLWNLTSHNGNMWYIKDKPFKIICQACPLIGYYCFECCGGRGSFICDVCDYS